jgi:hypothetical protein
VQLLASREVLKRRKRQKGTVERYMGEKVSGEVKGALFWEGEEEYNFVERIPSLRLLVLITAE